MVLFLYEHKRISRFSDLHQCTFFKLPLFFFSPPLARNNGEFGAKKYFADLQTAVAIKGNSLSVQAAAKGNSPETS